MSPDQSSIEQHKSSLSTEEAGGTFIMALRFFSRLPSGNTPHQKPAMGRIAMALPVVSIIIGLGPALLLLLGTHVGLPPFFAATLAVAAMALVSGAMTEDALADAADGLFGGHSVEHRLNIMKDSRHGSYGVAALCLFILLRVTALGAIATINPLAAGAIWLAATVIARSGALWLAKALPSARITGASADAGPLNIRHFLIGLLFALALFFVLAAPFVNLAALICALIASLVIVAIWAALCRRLAGGQTGDLIGALMALIEITALAALVASV